MSSPDDKRFAEKIEAILRKYPESDCESFRTTLRHIAKTDPDGLDRFLEDDDSWIERELLHLAAQDGDLARVNELLQQGHSVHHFDTIGHTPLHYAVESGHIHVVDRLLEAGANVNANDESVIGNTPLSDNAEKCSYEMAKRLIDAGADPTIRGWMQLDAIYHASKRTDPDAKRIQALLRDASTKFNPNR